MKLPLMAALFFVLFNTVVGKTAIAEEQKQVAQNGGMDAEYPDVPRAHWAHESIIYMSQVGVFEGYPDGLFRGNQPLTRYEFPVAMARFLNKQGYSCYAPGSAPKFRLRSLDELEKDRLFPRAHSFDVPRGHYAYEAVQLVQRLGIMQGNPQNQFLGDKPMTRYECTMALQRLLKLIDSARVSQ